MLPRHMTTLAGRARRLVLGVACSGVLAGCSSGPNAAIAVAVTVDPAVIGSCVRVAATPAGGTQELSPPAARKGTLEAAIYPSSQLSGQVTLQAFAYFTADGGCTDGLYLNAASMPTTLSFSAGAVARVSLEVTVPGMDVDQDQDGYWGSEQGGPDCDDQDPAIHPGAIEICNNGIDDNCNGLVDCQDPECPVGAVCDDGNACTSSDACAAGGTCQGQAKNCGPPPTSQCVSGWACDPASGSCSTVPVDAGLPCDAGINSCTFNDQCNTSGICQGTPLCMAPPNDCFSLVGSCATDGGCTYAPDPSRTYQACDGGVCKPDGTCTTLTFGYAPSNFDPASIPSAAIAGNVVLGCSATFDSTPDASTPFVWCSGQPQPLPFDVPQTGGPDAVVLPMYGFAITGAGSLQLTGPRPVILAVYDSASISGELLATSSYTTAGAGGSPALCGAHAGGAGGLTSAEGGGGGGGGYGVKGGAGGASGSAAGGGDAGTGGVSVTLVPLAGGCPGGVGGTNNGTAGAAGAGGGAVQVSSAGSLTVSGLVSSSGGGGRGAPSHSSGGGAGGSGGAILLEAPNLQVQGSAALTCNGGGGGQGASQSSGGGDGADGSSTNALQAQGGNSTGSGPGGAGGSFAGGATAGGPGTQGGGGGGGGVGIIRLNSNGSCVVSPSATLSPAPSLNGCP
jgi:hypothetical protein